MNKITENKYTNEDLKIMQAWSLERKIQVTQTKIIEWYQRFDGNVYVSFSGGKDSTVLLNLARRIYPNILAVYVDTGLEYPEIRDFVKSIDNVKWLYPQKYDRKTKEYKRYNFKDVILDHGYPIISKEVSNTINGARNNKDSVRYKKLNGTLLDNDGNKSIFNCEKYKYLLNAPFNCSDQCCNIMKKNPSSRFDKESGFKPILGLMASESKKRKRDYLKTGCNAFNKGKPQSQPMGFWTEQDILTYLKEFDVPYSKIYGNIIKEDSGKLTTTGEKRTGCMFCGYGCHLEKEPNRFQRMKITHPKQYEYCMKSVEDGGLGIGDVLDYIGVKY